MEESDPLLDGVEEGDEEALGALGALGVTLDADAVGCALEAGDAGVVMGESFMFIIYTLRGELSILRVKILERCWICER